ncbi:hypothetical protein TeGR_g5635 [Tetraparma gracilis]|uniref:Uncharacterized protein n=1 Tax=Tetraparma gracilis TaxID=2962635 RepID=A0ABQ6N790_9STRA|nr:hypothetical protein TeGR_g5635 [Tetraparma gracilis]
MPGEPESPGGESIARQRLEDAKIEDAKVASREAINGEIVGGSPLKPTPPPREHKREYKQAVKTFAEQMIGDVMSKALATPRK